MKLIYIFLRTNKLAQFLSAAIILLSLAPAVSAACACGCNVFSAGSMWMMPSSPGLRMALTYNYMDQHTDWSGWNSAAADLNSDKEIRTNFYTLGFQYMENRDWGMMIEIPVWDRYFTTIDDMGSIASIEHASPADIRIMGIYTGLSEDMSTGILLGLKLPTGPFNLSLLDRDTQIGTGTTDLLVGGFRMGQEAGWGWYVHAQFQIPLAARDGYLPGDNFDFSIGMHYDDLADDYKIVPSLQITTSLRSIDSGANSDPDNTGYERLYISPGAEIIINSHLNIFGNVNAPLITHTRGYQLVAPLLSTVTLSYRF